MSIPLFPPWFVVGRCGRGTPTDCFARRGCAAAADWRSCPSSAL